MQSAYRPQHSTETCLLKLHNDLTTAIDQGKAVFVVALDLSAALDTIDHQILLRRLDQEFGIRGCALKWIESYLAGRSQEVTVKDCVSSKIPLRFGVPQGSVLGPQLFTAYTTPLGKIIRSHLMPYLLYADDNNLYITFDPTDRRQVLDVMERLSLCIKDIQSWMTNNKLKLNEDKTEFLLACAKQHLKHLKDITLDIGGSIIPQSETVKLLGVRFDRHLTMSSHVNDVCRAANFHLYKIGKIRHLLTESATVSAVRTLVLSRMDYCNGLLSGATSEILRKLQLIQNSAARLVMRKSKREHITPLLFDLHWLPVAARVEYKVALMVFKCLQQTVPRYLQSAIATYTPSRALRSSNQSLCNQTQAKKCIGRCAFTVAGPHVWNILPPKLRAIDTLDLFKSNLKTHLFRKYLC